MLSGGRGLPNQDTESLAGHAALEFFRLDFTFQNFERGAGETAQRARV